ncbi:MAG TPA: ABC transporter ATP-binding protein [Vicinamibacterales bacterium]|nr:ABC transporter ATP-binding protein [Vicinamibacterales bacterium]
MAAVELDEVGVRFGPLVALEGVTLAIRPGEVFCLLGPSGSGKSTLLRVMAGVEQPTTGTVQLDGVLVAGPRTFVEPERRRVGMVFQDHALFPHLTIAGNVGFGLQGRGRGERETRVGALLDRVGLARYRASYPHMLSGGERQRAALVRALAPEPRVLLLDEPFSSLDSRLREQVRVEALDLVRETGTTTVVVTHDAGEAVRIADRIGLLREGRLVQCGTPDELYARPASVFAARFFGDVNELGGTCRGGSVETPLGSFASPHLAESSAARVCIRPQHVRVSAVSTGIRARVLAANRMGEHGRLLVEVPGLATPISLGAADRSRLSVGDTIHLDLDAAHAIVVPDDGPGGWPPGLPNGAPS